MALLNSRYQTSSSKARIRSAEQFTWMMVLVLLILPAVVLLTGLAILQSQREVVSQTKLQALDHQVDLNHASAVELSLLPGIGEKLADKIVQARQEAPFTSMEDLRARVNGIGEKVSLKFEAYVVPLGEDQTSIEKALVKDDSPQEHVKNGYTGH